MVYIFSEAAYVTNSCLELQQEKNPVQSKVNLEGLVVDQIGP